ncbi:type II toxin-antitoxin system HicA family toxin [Candidatus Acetothermia bacterium]|jgi:predicted RNA binding protein YcfA (HicA-like mRNA interferase family)|nr:type II toxin-antitoxin system HicA family toxin [Candidatus Acetothermia bacterium]MCI2431246.1 type II toxin-antitoxin system HicA family toxin [Candidatus Acetothermia bacterium]MCI2436859.1 type II toxin-antitoxin system HicA family toxin [Candidatus Acetothermia bacterium]
MSKLSPTHWKTQVRIFEKYGCVFVRQRGPHLIYDHPKARRPVVIPKYDEVPVTIIRTNMRTVGMTRGEYFRMLQDP